MKPYRIIKPKEKPRRKIKLINKLDPPKVPLYFFKNVHPPVVAEFIFREQSDHQPDSSDSQDL
jgi:hypothetical protein